MTLDDLDHYETDHESDQDMDVDSNELLNDNEATSSKSSPFSRDSSTVSDVTERKPPSSSGSPEPKATFSNSDEQAPPSSPKTKTKTKTKVKSTRTTPSTTTTLGRPTKAARKQSGAEQLSPEAKRQRFLERNRLAAAKCREKKRLQTLKTITNADEITAKNQALHESLEELQEEVRKLKNQILCHRDCGCDVIQKFVKSSLVPSSSRKMSLDWNPPFSPSYFHDG
ncbi:hypothetical protein BGZ59_009577 [Podila verticillata]|nr:hypothetical protein BGZ59_009577 [Podila verticillata]